MASVLTTPASVTASSEEVQAVRTVVEVSHAVHAESAEDLLRALNDHEETRTAFEQILPLVQRVLGVLAEGGSVTVGAIPAEITTTTAAALLGISRPTLMKRVRAGDIPHHMVGSHVRFASADIMELRDRQLQAARDAFEEARREQDALGIVD